MRTISLRSAQIAPNVHEMCQNDVVKFCTDVNGNGDGEVHQCLSEHLKELEEPCREAEFKVQVLKEDGISLNPKLRKSCAADADRWCAGVEDGGVVKCLQGHMEDDAMSGGCVKKLQKENKKLAVSLDYNLSLKKACKTTLSEFIQQGKPGCTFTSPLGVLGFAGKLGQTEGAKIKCLTSNIKDVKDKSCQAEVRNKISIESKNVNNVAGLRETCKADVDTLCPNMEVGGGRIVNCLVGAVDSIKSEACKESIANLKSAQKFDVGLNPVVKKACASEKRAFCKESTSSDLGPCLMAASIKQQDFGVKCGKAIKKYGIVGVERIFGFSGGGGIGSGSGSGSGSGMGGGEGGAVAGLVISGPLAFFALASLFVVLLGGALYCVKKRQTSKASGYSVVELRETNHML